jgi:ankyrin repeat protein
LQGNPLDTLPKESLEQHLEFLWPNALPKINACPWAATHNNNHTNSNHNNSNNNNERGPTSTPTPPPPQQGRQLLATYILRHHVGLALSIRPFRNGRTALHTACFYADTGFLQQLLERLKEKEQEDIPPSAASSASADTYLNQTCEDSGWAPLHYAVISGSSQILETLLAAGAQVSIKTDHTRTWRERYVL